MRIGKNLVLFIILIISMFLYCFETNCYAISFTGVGAEQLSKEEYTDIDDSDGTPAATIKSIARKILGVIQIASAVATVFVVIFTGYNYIVGTAEMKRDELKKMLPIIIGLAATFLATTIFNLILGINVEYTKYT